MNTLSHIRNFSIIAHIDHGKSTLADRLLEFTGTLHKRKMRQQVLDQMDLEREHGITIKAKAITLQYKDKKNCLYLLNLIDTPGHVDFSYEVSRSLAACEGTLLLVDASQGIQAQTLANAHIAKSSNLTIIPVINKIDLPTADPDGVRAQIKNILNLKDIEPIEISAKEGIGTDKILEAIVQFIPAPAGKLYAPLKAFIFDSVYDVYRGVIIYTRIIDGTIKKGTKMKMLHVGKTFEVEEVGIFHLDMVKTDQLNAGEVGYIIANIKDPQNVKIGDTIADARNLITEMLKGYKETKPLVFCGLYPVDTDEYELLLKALEKLRLNDMSFTYTQDSSTALGFGFRCGFLGLLHMEIIKERLQREYNLHLIITSPNVVYHVRKKDMELLIIDNPSKLPPHGDIDNIAEPYIKGIISLSSIYVGTVMQLAQEKRGIFKDLTYIDTQHAVLTYEMPLAEIIFDFYDHLKSLSSGYASFDYEHIGWRKSNLVKLDVLVNNESIDSFCFIVHKDKAYEQGNNIVTKLKDIIPRQMFAVPIQASVNNKIIARQTIRAMKKDVIAKCYGGDISRKRKLLEKQKEGKKKMKKIGKIELPQETFIKILKID